MTAYIDKKREEEKEKTCEVMKNELQCGKTGNKMSILKHKVQIVKDLPDNIEWSENVGLDTEAMGLKPGRDRLCVVQIFNPKNNIAYIIETPLKKIKAINLIKLLKNKNICKIMHFARFDLRSIKEYFNIDIKNFFCTHIASIMARTYSSKHSLYILCNEFLGVTLNKACTISDWGNHHHLSQEQINYAVGDVLYLHLLKEKLLSMLKREKRLKLCLDTINCLIPRINLDINGWSIDIFDHHRNLR